MPSYQELNALFYYEASTGKLLWRYRFDRPVWFNEKYAGKEAGRKGDRGYRDVVINGAFYRSHRVIWAMLHDETPIEIDHVNGIRDDNREENLRASNSSLNHRNYRMSTRNTSGFNGVMRRKEKWEAYVRIDRKRRSLGFFEKKEDAIAARKEANKKFGFDDRHGT